MSAKRVYGGRIEGHRFILSTFHGDVVFREHLFPEKAQALQELFDSLANPVLVGGLLREGSK